MRQQNRNYYRNLKHYAERGNADEYIIYGSKRRNGCEICTFSGDPWRVEVVKKYLDNPKKVAFMREFNTYTGTYKGVEITVTSTGIGAPSAAIAMEEMYESGMQVAVRMGTVMSMQDDMLGHFMIPIAAMRREGTSQSYVDLSYPAVADVELVNVMNETVQQMGKRYLNGLNCTMDGFYSCMHDSSFLWNVDGICQRHLKRLRNLE